MARPGRDAGAPLNRATSAPEAVAPEAEAKLTAPATERLGPAHLRDERAGRRDQAAEARDRLAAGRDRQADVEDQRALELEGVDGLWDKCTFGVRELRVRGIEGRDRARHDRELAKRQRGLAEIDRELGERDRQQSKLDREFAATDELTGARRRGVGLEDLQREIDRARRTGETLVAAYIDVDGLKSVNDQHGHGAGDALLRDVVESLRREMRSYDLLVRLGGDEFLCVMPGATADQARQRFEHLGSDLPGGRGGSVSIGLVQLRDGEGPTGLVQRADQELLAGRGGR